MNKINETLISIGKLHSVTKGCSISYTDEYKQLEKVIKGLEIFKNKVTVETGGVESFFDFFSQTAKKQYLVIITSKDTRFSITICVDTQEEANLIKEVLE